MVVISTRRWTFLLRPRSLSVFYLCFISLHIILHYFLLHDLVAIFYPLLILHYVSADLTFSLRVLGVDKAGVVGAWVIQWTEVAVTSTWLHHDFTPLHRFNRDSHQFQYRADFLQLNHLVLNVSLSLTMLVTCEHSSSGSLLCHFHWPQTNNPCEYRHRVHTILGVLEQGPCKYVITCFSQISPLFIVNFNYPIIQTL